VLLCCSQKDGAAVEGGGWRLEVRGERLRERLRPKRGAAVLQCCCAAVKKMVLRLREEVGGWRLEDRG
jgi:hypothetical protein